MGYLKEPEGVDFIIKSPPLTEKERKSISEFIKKDKSKRSKYLRRKRQIKPEEYNTIK